MSPSNLEIFAALMHSPRTPREAADYAGIKFEQARLHLKQMHDRGLVYVLDWRRSGNRWVPLYTLQTTPHQEPDAPLVLDPHKSERGVWRNLKARHWLAPGWICFRDFFASVGPRPSPKHRLVRANTMKPYGPGNCRWENANE